MNTFNSLEIGTAFRCRGGEKISHSKYVPNGSVYIKVGANSAVDAVNVNDYGTYKDCIFHLKQVVQPIGWKPQMQYIPQSYVNNGGQP
jgi:hypothetical protein